MQKSGICAVILLLTFSFPIFAEKAGVTFDTDKDTLKPESFETLDRVGAEIMNYYRADTGMKITITGHTDFRASNAYNINLSQRRANTVKKYFMEKLKIPDGNFYYAGLGEEKPIATNKTDEGMAINRRVEVEYAGQKVILSSIIKDTPTVTMTNTAVTETVFTATNTPELTPTNTPEIILSATPTATITITMTSQPSVVPENRSNRLGFIVMTGAGVPFGGAQGEAAYNHMAVKIGLEMAFANRLCLNVESAVYRLFNGSEFISDFGEFALGAGYEFLDGFMRPYAGAKVLIARSKMKNDSYVPGFGLDAGAKFFFSEYVAGVAGLELLGMADSMYTANLNIGVEIYTARDDNWGWKYNRDEYKKTNEDIAEEGENK